MSIVVAYSADTAGEAALAFAAQEARLRGERLIVVNATRGDALVDPRYAAAGQLQGMEEVLAGVEHEIRQPMGPDVADLVLAEVDSSGAELLVVGLRRRTPVGKLNMGSVSQRLLLDSPVPVFAVHPAS